MMVRALEITQALRPTMAMGLTTATRPTARRITVTHLAMLPVTGAMATSSGPTICIIPVKT